jgi:hypothetical protein
LKKGNEEVGVYLHDDEQFEKEGTKRRGNKGCVAKLATKAKRDLLKQINRRAKKCMGK